MISSNTSARTQGGHPADTIAVPFDCIGDPNGRPRPRLRTHAGSQQPNRTATMDKSSIAASTSCPSCSARSRVPGSRSSAAVSAAFICDVQLLEYPFPEQAGCQPESRSELYRDRYRARVRCAGAGVALIVDRDVHLGAGRIARCPSDEHAYVERVVERAQRARHPDVRGR